MNRCLRVPIHMNKLYHRNAKSLHDELIRFAQSNIEITRTDGRTDGHKEHNTDGRTDRRTQKDTDDGRTDDGRKSDSTTTLICINYVINSTHVVLKAKL